MGKVIEDGIFGEVNDLMAFLKGMRSGYSQISEEYENEIGYKAKIKLEVIERLIIKLKEGDRT